LTAKPLKKRFNLVVYWRRKYLKNSSKSPWYLLTNLDNPEQVKNFYQKRWGIECLFRDLKRGGYQLESTYVNSQRLSSLILLITISLTNVWLQGQKIIKLGLSDYIARPKERGRIKKRFSNFSLGLAYFRYLTLYNLSEPRYENIVNSPPSRPTLFPQHLR
jgi:Transposase DDE domain